MNYEEIIKTHDIYSIVINKKCPLHDDRHSSFSIFVRNGIQLWKCHTCDKSGTIIDLMGYMNIPGYDKRQDRYRAAQLLSDNVTVSFVPPAKQEKEKKILPSWLWKDYLPIANNVRRYANKRGIEDWQIEEYHLGSMSHWHPLDKKSVDTFLTIPTFTINTLVSVKFRNVGEGGRYLSYPGSRIALFNYDKVAGKNETVILCKGEIAAMVVENRIGVLTCAPTCGENSDPNNMKEALSFARVIVIGDNDKVGDNAGNRRAKMVRGELHFPPEYFKDVDEWLLNEKDQAVKEIRSWIQ